MKYLSSGIVRHRLVYGRQEPIEPYVALRIARPSGTVFEVELTPAEALRAAEELLVAARRELPR